MMDEYDSTRADRVDDDESAVELTAEERQGFAQLPDQARPSDLLEERVVGALRSRGILRGAGERASGPSSGRRPLARSRWWAAPAAWAAGIALFVAGGVIGHGVGARTTTDAFLAVRQQDAALRVQEAGTAYVSALMALEAMHGDSSAPGGEDRGAVQAREVASSTLLAAAHAYARLDPDGRLTPMLTTLLEEQVNPRDADRKQQTIWF